MRNGLAFQAIDPPRAHPVEAGAEALFGVEGVLPTRHGGHEEHNVVHLAAACGGNRKFIELAGIEPSPYKH